MKRQCNPKLIEELVSILVRYDPDELKDAIEFLSDPTGLANLTKLVSRALDAGVRKKATPAQKPAAERKPSDEERISQIKASRPADSALVDEITTITGGALSKSTVQRLNELLQRRNEGPIGGDTAKRRYSQLLSRIERANRVFLEEIVTELRAGSQHGGTLQEWSDIILRDRKPKT